VIVAALPEAASPSAADAASVCVVCEALRRENNFRLDEIDATADIAAAGEAVVDSMGFCGSHALFPNSTADKDVALVRLLRDASDRVLGMLGDESRYFERLLDLFFAADRACAACKVDDQHAAQRVHRLVDDTDFSLACPPLCYAHYRNIAYALKAPALPALARAQLRTAERIGAQVGTIDSWERSGTTEKITSATLARALAFVAGDSRTTRNHSWLDQDGDEALAQIRCRVCVEIAGAEQHWFDMVKRVAALGEDSWTVFPTCRIHVHACARFGDAWIAASTLRYAVEITRDALHAGIEALDYDKSNREIAAKSVFYRRQGAAYILGQQRKMIASLPRCPACERALVAQERGIAGVLQALRQARSGRVDEEAGGLCLKHFATVYLHTLGGETRSRLVAMQTERLRGLSARLAQIGNADDPVTGDALRQAIDMWQTAISRPEDVR